MGQNQNQSSMERIRLVLHDYAAGGPLPTLLEKIDTSNADLSQNKGWVNFTIKSRIKTSSYDQLTLHIQDNWVDEYTTEFFTLLELILEI